MDALKYVLTVKYEQCPEFRSELERSGGLYIVENQSSFSKPADTYGAKLDSGRLRFSGPNLMGRLLMELREKGVLAYTLPPDCTDFSHLLH